MCYTWGMNTQLLSLPTGLSDEALIARVKQLAAREREATVFLIAHLAELDARRLYLDEGCSSLFTYCTQVLRLSEHAAYGRIEAARAARRFPLILELLEEGAITLTTVCLLAAHLTEANQSRVLEAARHLSKRQVEELVARLHPQPAVPSSVRRLPGTQRQDSESPAVPSAAAPAEAVGLDGLAEASSPASPLSAASTTPRPAIVAPLAPERYRVQFTAGAEMIEKLRLAQALLRHQIPDGDPAAIFERALTMLVDSLTKQKVAATDRPRPPRAHEPTSPAESAAAADGGTSRHIPAATRRAVWEREGGRCAFVSRSGRRCGEDGFLEFHHVVPFSAGGTATVDNIELRCRSHNVFETYNIPRETINEGKGELGPDRVRSTWSHVDRERVVSKRSSSVEREAAAGAGIGPP